MNTKLPLLGVLLAPLLAFSQTTLVDEDFSSGSLPSNWTIVDNDGGGQVWEFNDPGGRSISAGNFSGNYAILDSDEHGWGGTQDADLVTPSFDASLYSKITLSYDYQFRYYSGSETCKVDVYNGSTWVNVATYISGNYSGSTLENLDITTAANGSSNAKVRFVYAGNWDWWFAIDNVVIEAEAPATVNVKGPGGVGTTDGSSGLVAWYTPSSVRNSSNNLPSDNESVQYWNDMSGNNNTLTNSGSVTYQSGSSDLINGHAKSTFTSVNRQFVSSSNISGRTVIVVNDPGSRNSFEGVVGFNGDKGIRRSSGGDNAWQYAGGGDGVNDDTWSTNTGDSYVNGSNSNAGTHNNSLHFVSQTRTSNYSNKFYAGGYYSGRYFTGDLLEIMIFNRELTTVEKNVIDNYLSAKYDIALAGTDYYSMDESSKGDFDFNVAGIGQDTDGNTVSNAQGTGIIQMHSPSSLGNGDHLFWGENIQESDYSFSTASNYMERCSSVWRVSETNDVGTVSVSVSENDLDLSAKQSCASISLVVSSTSDFSSKTNYPLTLSNGFYTAEDVSFTDEDYFSFEYQDLVVIDGSGYHNGTRSSGAPGNSDGCYKLLIKSTADGSYNIRRDASVRELEVESGGEINLTNERALTITNNIINNGTITIDENSSLIQNSTGVNANSGSGTYNVVRTGNNNAYVYNIWSSPISSATLTTIFSDANPCDIWTFDENNQAWKADYANGFSTTCYGNAVTFTNNDIIAGGDGLMDVTRGYFIPGALTSQRTYTGQINNGDYTKAIKTTNLGNPGLTDWDDDDWNLLGNPYPSALDADAFWQENAIDNNRITDALYFWDEADTTGGYNQNSDYASWNLTGGVKSGNTNDTPNGYIASGQGFWVVANQNTDVVFNNSMRHNSNNQFFKTDDSDKHNAWFSFTSPSNIENNILVGYNPNTTDGLDAGYDAHKLAGNSHVRFASLMDGDEFVIQSLAPIQLNSSKTIPLVVFSDETGNHTFSNYNRKNIPNGFKIYIRDKFLGIDFDLGNGDYLAQLSANVEYKTRFELVFKNLAAHNNDLIGVKDGNITKPNGSDQVTNTQELTENIFKLAYSADGYILKNESGMKGTVKILDVTGKTIWTSEIAKGSTAELINLSNVTSGIYFIEVTNNNERIYNNKILKQ